MPKKINSDLRKAVQKYFEIKNKKVRMKKKQKEIINVSQVYMSWVNNGLKGRLLCLYLLVLVTYFLCFGCFW